MLRDRLLGLHVLEVLDVGSSDSAIERRCQLGVTERILGSFGGSDEGGDVRLSRVTKRARP